MFIKALFFFGLFILWYSYFGYGILLYLWLKVQKRYKKDASFYADDSFKLPVTLIVAAFNEQEFIEKKIINTLELQYPRELLNIFFVTDGSTDKTPEIVKGFPEIQLFHIAERNGKVAAMHRAMSYVKTPIVIFSDANTFLNPESINHIVRHYQDKSIGGVAGEKKILQEGDSGIAGSGEGLYWRYESFLKQLDSDFYTVVGAAGELFSVRTELYEYPGNNALLDDFVISIRVCLKGYRVVYESDAYALESPSASIKDERKRKTRISAGAFQSIQMLKKALQFWNYPILFFQYLSHRVLRWTLCPLLLPAVLFLNIWLVINEYGNFYTGALILQSLFYTCALIGYILSFQKKKISIFYASYYFLFINLNLYAGFLRFMRGRQSVLWEKAERKAILGP